MWAKTNKTNLQFSKIQMKTYTKHREGALREEDTNYEMEGETV